LHGVPNNALVMPNKMIAQLTTRKVIMLYRGFDNIAQMSIQFHNILTGNDLQ